MKMRRPILSRRIPRVATRGIGVWKSKIVPVFPGELRLLRFARSRVYGVSFSFGGSSVGSHLRMRTLPMVNVV